MIQGLMRCMSSEGVSTSRLQDHEIMTRLHRFSESRQEKRRKHQSHLDVWSAIPSGLWVRNILSCLDVCDVRNFLITSKWTSNLQGFFADYFWFHRRRRETVEVDEALLYNQHVYVTPSAWTITVDWMIRMQTMHHLSDRVLYTAFYKMMRVLQCTTTERMRLPVLGGVCLSQASRLSPIGPVFPLGVCHTYFQTRCTWDMFIAFDHEIQGILSAYPEDCDISAMLSRLCNTSGMGRRAQVCSQYYTKLAFLDSICVFQGSLLRCACAAVCMAMNGVFPGRDSLEWAEEMRQMTGYRYEDLLPLIKRMSYHSRVLKQTSSGRVLSACFQQYAEAVYLGVSRQRHPYVEA